MENPDRHGSVSVTLELPADPARVFAAFAQFEQRDRWFRMPGASADRTHELDFREGGHETMHGVVQMFDVRETLDFRSRFFAIERDRRIVYAYELFVQEVRHGVSLVDIALTPTPAGTRLEYTDQFTLLGPEEGLAAAARERRGSTRLQLNGLVAVLNEP